MINKIFTRWPYNFKKYLSKKYKLTVVTILPGRKSDNKTVKILDI